MVATTRKGRNVQDNRGRNLRNKTDEGRVGDYVGYRTKGNSNSRLERTARRIARQALGK